ncbi:hypothetical protein C5E07_06925 [Pseudoclavibacter sp. RFBJ3]|uniref:hypothetical protein n=1 Tax=unclassified Pseudoclavibacter TaxID=2615177 RepID=UPI000CE9289C|nr:MULTISPECIES: hypothetical protein [unclassified Pseudoclavibacter]PPF85384.1 hypothetical protein C5C12_03850 [Pseudoclavibacter sp. RFBJ5]PPF93222.1 hypothetical protein C5E07_06925 [Pseudoclavibacter sp. RFBJ3]PPF98868.1 hypothetical protein C5C19_06205 [Pseudoclavibacter sp. RFBH5]PPG25000.1 hypothetical protein C5E13_05635 [Pseudoclavibacter sp. RFBI4]
MSDDVPTWHTAEHRPVRPSAWRPILGWSIATVIILFAAAATLVIGVFLALSVGEVLHYGPEADASDTWTTPKGHYEEAILTTWIAGVAHFLVWFFSLSAAAITAACTHKSVWWSLAIITVLAALEISAAVVIQHVRYEAGEYLG